MVTDNEGGNHPAQDSDNRKAIRSRGIRVIVYDPDPVPRDFYQWDGIHFNAAAHAKIAATLAAQIATTTKATPAAETSAPVTGIFVNRRAASPHAVKRRARTR